MSILDAEQLRSLFSLSSGKDIESFLSHIEANSDRWKWFPLGGRENNSGSVNLAMDPGHALVERITNAMDAHIELQFEMAGRPSGLSSPREAVRRLWNLETSRLTRESPSTAKFIDEMAPKNLVRVVGSERRKDSAVIIQDSGIGQHPDDLPKTILGLQESNKNEKRYLMGAFGQGGSSTFAYCPYSLIISRRHKQCLGSRHDLIGWTIVRQYDDDLWKTFRYEYLVGSDGLIPRMTPEEIDSLGINFESGTRIVHFSYELGRLKKRWSLVGYRFFDNLLFDPVLPYRIEDHRISPHFNRNLYGGRNRLDQTEKADRPDAQTFEADLSRWGGEGTVRIRYWVFRPRTTGKEEGEDDSSVKLNSYLDYDNSPRTILFTLNGQRHHTRDKGLVREARLGALADYLLVHVDCDDLSMRLKKEMFTATRAGATIGEKREDLIINAIKEALDDPWLKQKLKEMLLRLEAKITSESTRRVNQMLNRLITVYRQETFPGGRAGGEHEGAGKGHTERQIHDPPRSLRFADHRRLEMIGGDQTTIFLITDGPDEILIRRRRRGSLSLAIEGDRVGSLYVGDMHNGKIPVRVIIPSESTSGQSGRIIASLKVGPHTLLSDTREIRIMPPPPPYVGAEPPTRLKFAKETNMRIEVGRKSVTQAHTDARNDLLTRAIGPASIQGFTDVPGVFISVRGPRDGVAHVEVSTDTNASVGAEGIIGVRLVLSDGTEFTTTRAITLIAFAPQTPSPGKEEAQNPAYKVLRVWQEVPEDATDSISWATKENYDNDKVGHYELNGDALWLYINMDERQFQLERLRWRKTFGEGTSQRLIDRYVAYLAFHLFQMYDHSQEGAPKDIPLGNIEGNGDENGSERQYQSYDPESRTVGLELRRVAGTLIQALRSEAQLMQLEANTKNPLDQSGI